MARSKTRLLHPAGGCLSQTLPSTLISLIMVIWCKMRTMTNARQACQNIPLEIIIFMSNAACRLCTEPFLVPLKCICQLQDESAVWSSDKDFNFHETFLFQKQRNAWICLRSQKGSPALHSWMMCSSIITPISLWTRTINLIGPMNNVNTWICIRYRHTLPPLLLFSYSSSFLFFASSFLLFRFFLFFFFFSFFSFSFYLCLANYRGAVAPPAPLWRRPCPQV